MASTLDTPYYYKQVENVDKKRKKKTKRDETAAPVLYAKPREGKGDREGIPHTHPIP